MFNFNSKKCPQCNTENKKDANYCRKCGYEFGQSDPIVEHHHWVRKPDEFAVRIETQDLPGMLRRGLIIELGTNALLVERGVCVGVVPPGAYVLESAGQKVWDWLKTGIPEQATVLLVDVTPTDLEFSLGGRFTKDPLPIGITIRLRADVTDPGKFLINVLKGNTQISKEDLRLLLYPEVVQTADRWLSQHELDELVNQPQRRAELELAIEEELRTIFAQSGLRFLQVRAVELNLEPYDEVKGIRGKQKLLIYKADAEADLAQTQTDADVHKAQAELEAKKRFSDIQHQVNLQALTEETHKVELEERKVEVYQRMRQAVMSDRMNEVRSEADFEKFLNQMDHQKLLGERERSELLRTWAEQDQDHDRARAHLLAKLEVEQDFSLRMQALKAQSDLSTAQMDIEINLTRKRLEWEIEQKRRIWEQEIELESQKRRIEKERAAAEQERERARIDLDTYKRQTELDNDRDEALLGMELLEKMKGIHRADEEASLRIRRLDEEERLRMQRVHKIELDRAAIEIEIQRMDAQERQRQAEREFELRRIQELSKLSAEALISLSGPDQARVLADLKKTEAMKGMTEDQILALAAKESPQVAQALAEKFRAIAAGQASKETIELYERLIGEKEISFRRSQEEADKRVRDVTQAHEHAAERSQQTTERALDRISDTAQAFARSQSNNTPIVITPSSGGPQVIQSSGYTSQGGLQASDGQEKFCTHCGKKVHESVNFCPHCGAKFEGMG